MQYFLTAILFSFFSLCFALPVWAVEGNIEKSQPSLECIPACPDYSKDISWASKPINPQKNVDVFYVYPTIYPETFPKNMDVFDKSLRADVQGLLKAQAGVFSGSANLFAPYYRQVTFACLDQNQDMMLNSYFRIGADDVHRAFDYYLNFLNNGRPFILAAHSQGSVVLLDLIRSRFKDPKLQNALVAAYLIGYSVTDKDLKNYPWIKPAQKADDTGVVISWNTQEPGATGSPVLRSGATCINPLTWTTDETPADKSLNLGAVFFDDFNGTVIREVPQYTGARVDKKSGALITIPPDKMEIGHFPKGVLHKFDYAFWYRNIEKNVQDRIKAYLKKHK
ncbi:DUF3089 domain-containing protein [Desulfovibrio gilichinskyi]|uniref:DUF3089 domain-containing protein n=1 Tax=Desulfovibrio gilichinskyi TaxID=1519643 RepID=A0A1X7C9W8_9BACT|nr:DUF3089 domain-containing protein [Desulfovibrio gilichinskyi]SME92656.1 Protein of unknown function [Desulfovibrio gilichinskyi]